MSSTKKPYFDKQQSAGFIALAVILVLLVFSIFMYSPFQSVVENEIFGLVYFGVVVPILVLAFVVVLFRLIGNTDLDHALGLPQGSVRALIALTLIVLFSMIGMSTINKMSHSKVTFPSLSESELNRIDLSKFYDYRIDTITLTSLKNDDLVVTKQFILTVENRMDNEAKDLGKQVVTTLATLVIAVSSFYFGGKATEQGGKYALSIFKQGQQPNDPPISPQPDQPGPEIPGGDSGSTGEELTLDIVDAFILEYESELLDRFKADAVQAAMKVEKGETQRIPCAQFIVKDKYDLPEGAEEIPDYLDYNEHRIATDVKEEDIPTEDANEYSPGDAIVRKGTKANGTLGLKVYRENEYGITEYLLSCYHVFCSPELKKGVTDFQSDPNALITPSRNNGIIIGEVSEGVFNSQIDAAICEISDGVNTNSQLKGFSATPQSGIRVFTNKDVVAQTKVFTYGAVTKARAGTLIARKIDRKINIYGKLFQFEDIIPVTKISVPGDSGALVADEKGKTVGIVFASNSTTSFIIPISKIIRKFNIKISHV